MTKVVFFRHNDVFYGFRETGHTGYGDEGYDILCASISSMTMFMINSINSVFEGEYTEGKGARNIIKVFEEAGFKSMHIHYPYPEFFGEEADVLSTIGYIIGRKEIRTFACICSIHKL